MNMGCEAPWAPFSLVTKNTCSVGVDKTAARPEAVGVAASSSPSVNTRATVGWAQASVSGCRHAAPRPLSTLAAAQAHSRPHNRSHKGALL